MMNHEDLKGNRKAIFKGSSLIEGYVIMIRNRCGYGGYYHRDLDWSFEANGKDYQELIDNIAPQYFKHMTSNEGKFNDFEMGSYDIYTCRYMTYKEEIFVDEYHEEKDIELNRTTDQVHQDIINSKKYKAE